MNEVPQQAVAPEALLTGLQQLKMADRTEASAALLPSQPAHTVTVPAALEVQYDRIAQAVATLLSPTITAAVDRAKTTGIDQLRREIR